MVRGAVLPEDLREAGDHPVEAAAVACWHGFVPVTRRMAHTVPPVAATARLADIPFNMLRPVVVALQVARPAEAGVRAEAAAAVALGRFDVCSLAFMRSIMAAAVVRRAAVAADLLVAAAEAPQAAAAAVLPVAASVCQLPTEP